MLTPLPGIPGIPRAPRAPRMNSRWLKYAVFYHDFGTFARKMKFIFDVNPANALGEPKAGQREPKGDPEHPKGSPREPRGTPKGAKGSPRALFWLRKEPLRARTQAPLMFGALRSLKGAMF